MSLREKQSKFAYMIALLILHAKALGYEVTFGDAYRDKRVKYGHPKSLHRDRLAVDFNVYKNGKWLENGDDFKDLGEYWESIGGSWGGRFNDGNHFSIEHEGMK